MRIPQDDLDTKSIDWFAIDANDEIACFTNSMSGALPEVVVSSKRNYDLLGELLDLPPIDEAVFREDLLDQIARLRGVDKEMLRQGLLDWHGAIAASGLYSYQADYWSGRWKGLARDGYTLVARPQVPVRLPQLPPEIREALGLVRFSWLRFRESMDIAPDEVMRL